MDPSYDDTRDLVYAQILLDLAALGAHGNLQDAERTQAHHQLLLMQGGFPQAVCDAYELLYGQIWGGILAKELARVQAKGDHHKKRRTVISAKRQVGNPGVLRSPESRQMFIDEFIRTYEAYQAEHGVAPSDKVHASILQLTYFDCLPRKRSIAVYLSSTGAIGDAVSSGRSEPAHGIAIASGTP
jgi:hypothetical protein